MGVPPRMSTPPSSEVTAVAVSGASTVSGAGSTIFLRCILRVRSWQASCLCLVFVYPLSVTPALCPAPGDLAGRALPSGAGSGCFI